VGTIGLEPLLKGPFRCAEFAKIVGTGTTKLEIDDVHAKNVVFENVEVKYSGKRAILENVQFINCRFDFKPEQLPLQLAMKIAGAQNISFSTD